MKFSRARRYRQTTDYCSIGLLLNGLALSRSVIFQTQPKSENLLNSLNSRIFALKRSAILDLDRASLGLNFSDAGRRSIEILVNKLAHKASPRETLPC